MAQAMTDVEGSRCDLWTAQKDDRPHIRPESIDSGHLLPREKALRPAGSAYRTRRIGACPAPTRHRRQAFGKSADYTPSVTFGDTSPYTPGAIAPPGLPTKSGGGTTWKIRNTQNEGVNYV